MRAGHKKNDPVITASVFAEAAEARGKSRWGSPLSTEQMQQLRVYAQDRGLAVNSKMLEQWAKVSAKVAERDGVAGIGVLPGARITHADRGIQIHLA